MRAADGSGRDRQRPRQYGIRVQGHLDARWAAWFDGLTLTHEIDGTTAIRGLVVDQAALHGVLRNVRDLGLPLVSVMQIDPALNEGSNTSRPAALPRASRWRAR